MQNKWLYNKEQAAQMAHCLLIIALFVFILLLAKHSATEEQESETVRDPSAAVLFPPCTFCWYEWLAGHPLEKQKP